MLRCLGRRTAHTTEAPWGTGTCEGLCLLLLLLVHCVLPTRRRHRCQGAAGAGVSTHTRC
eukprot:4516-Heterococcus_DN1.PRE.2